MKKIILLFLLITSWNTLYSQSSWFWQQPYPTGNQFYCVKLVDAQTGYAAGVLGTIVKTTNGGLNWVALNTNCQTTFRSIDYVDANIVVAGGDSGYIIRTSNGGLNWTKQTIAGATTKLRGIDFAKNTPVGFIAAENGFVYKTTNTGLNWTQINPGTINPLLSVSFLDSLNGFVGGVALITKTTNGGLTWVPNSLGLGGFDFINSVSYNDPLNAVILLEADRIYKTIDGGLNWTPHTLDLSSVSECCDFGRYQSFANVNTGFLISDFGTILKTTNGGVNWSYITNYTRYDSRIGLLWGLNALDTNNVITVGTGGKILRSTDGAASWNIQNGFKKTLYGNYFTSPNTGYSVGDSGKILKTTNGGDNWDLMESGTTRKLSSIYFLDENTGYSVGDTGTILKTINAGISWIAQNSLSQRNFEDLYFTNSETGYVCGGYLNNGNAVILKTTNSGDNWNVIFSQSSFGTIVSIYFLNTTTGIFCNEDVIYKTTNEGTNWFQVASGSNGRGNDLFFSDALHGICIGSTTRSFRTTNGGDNWIVLTNSVRDEFLRCVYSVNNFLSFAVGENGTVSKSTNGGNNWTIFTKISTNNFYSAFFIDSNTGYIAGEYGTLLKTTNGGMTFITNLNSNIPKDFALLQNYPNPFNPSTQINYKVKSSGLIKLTLYSLTGKEIINLVNENQTPGEYKVILDASTLPSGVYFYSLFNNDKLLNTKKCILLK